VKERKKRAICHVTLLAGRDTMRHRQQSAQKRLLGILATALTAVSLCHVAKPVGVEINDFMLERMRTDHVPGLSAVLVARDKIIWEKAYGWADVDQKILMTVDTVQNIGSISKTITATAVMQLWEKRRFGLDDDVGRYLPFKVRNPRFPDDPITFRQLLTHKSSIKDGPAYGQSYACGDPQISLKDWIRGYLTPGGRYYSRDDNFFDWKPGTTDIPKGTSDYSNVGFGLLGYLVETISGMDFDQYCKIHIFTPLGMKETGWKLADIDAHKHAVPYTYISEDFKMPEEMGLESFLPRYGKGKQSITKGELFPHCLYGFPNYPDGLIRTNVKDLSRFLRAYINEGTFEGQRILKRETVQSMLSRHHYGRGLCWFPIMSKNDQIVWGHSGGDPGIATQMQLLQKEGAGVIVFFNFDSPRKGCREIIDRLLDEGIRAAGDQGGSAGPPKQELK
jgi:CubicO group peptidase (beta-lactamase class C family)